MTLHALLVNPTCLQNFEGLRYASRIKEEEEDETMAIPISQSTVHGHTFGPSLFQFQYEVNLSLTPSHDSAHQNTPLTQKSCKFVHGKGVE